MQGEPFRSETKHTKIKNGLLDVLISNQLMPLYMLMYCVVQKISRENDFRGST
jgi:hypothetical protein